MERSIKYAINSYFSINQNKYLMLTICGLVCIGYLFMEMINGRFAMVDFEVVHRAANRLLIGEKLYWPVEDGFYHYKYGPSGAILFIPLTLFSFETARIIYWIAISILIVRSLYLCMILSNSITEFTPKRINYLVFVGALILGVHFELEIHLGQINIILFVLYLEVIHQYLNHKKILSFFLLTFSFFLKPFGLILIPYFIIKRAFREIGLLMLFSVLFFFLPILFFGSFENLIDQSHAWIIELFSELSKKQSLLAEGNHTIFSILARYTPLKLIDWTVPAVKIYQLITVIILGIPILVLLRKSKENPEVTIYEFAIIISLIPLLAFTNINSFMFKGLAVFLLLLRFNDLLNYEKWLAITGFILSGFNIRDLWGQYLADKINAWSLISIGTILILIALYLFTYRLINRKKI